MIEDAPLMLRVSKHSISFFNSLSRRDPKRENLFATSEKEFLREVEAKGRKNKLFDAAHSP
jgi:hypothetical protein